jgi:DNA replication licensing factor MCM3
VYGQYDRERRIQENIGLPDSLLSRFDLLFIVLDQLDPVTDRHVASHVIHGHRYLSTYNQYINDNGIDTDSDDEDSKSPNLENMNSIWHRSNTFVYADEYSHTGTHSNDILKHDFLRKYIHFAKARVKPVLTDTAREFIVSR